MKKKKKNKSVGLLRAYAGRRLYFVLYFKRTLPLSFFLGFSFFSPFFLFSSFPVFCVVCREPSAGVGGRQLLPRGARRPLWHCFEDGEGRGVIAQWSNKRRGKMEWRWETSKRADVLRSGLPRAERRGAFGVWSAGCRGGGLRRWPRASFHLINCKLFFLFSPLPLYMYACTLTKHSQTPIASAGTTMRKEHTIAI